MAPMPPPTSPPTNAPVPGASPFSTAPVSAPDPAPIAAPLRKRSPGLVPHPERPRKAARTPAPRTIWLRIADPRYVRSKFSNGRSSALFQDDALRLVPIISWPEVIAAGSRHLQLLEVLDDAPRELVPVLDDAVDQVALERA